jgi:drug/metabolite transporter (DMT)-like permease
MRPVLVLAVALIGISFAGPLVRLSSADPLAIAIWRVGLSLVIIAVALAATGEWRQWRSLGRRELTIAIGAGTMLALHFWSWNASVGLTTVAASVVLVNLHPAIVALLSALWLRESPDRQQKLGIALALGGAFLVAAGGIGLGDGLSGRRALLGNVLAVIGAITVAIYYVIGRRLRQSLHLWAYVGLVYSACFVVSLGLALARGVPLLHQPPRELAIFAGLALGPMLLGHTGMNWALRYLPAYVVALTTLGEPVGATLLAALLPGIAEVPSEQTIVGGTLILFGVLITARRGR